MEETYTVTKSWLLVYTGGPKRDFRWICHGRKSNLVEFQILLVESPTIVSTSRKDKLGTKSNWSFYR